MEPVEALALVSARISDGEKLPILNSNLIGFVYNPALSKTPLVEGIVIVTKTDQLPDV
jgi:hypothetical protein